MQFVKNRLEEGGHIVLGGEECVQIEKMIEINKSLRGVLGKFKLSSLTDVHAMIEFLQCVSNLQNAPPNTVIHAQAVTALHAAVRDIQRK
ncbi:hypothetical protein BIY23_02620 [Wolbachia pipientis]|uniref:Uncharacterized protein n=1 Tax=Wolbachia pipientis TaxID=955 RepID=A0A1E7QK41_WOLPI|nr:hypothetical protein [Wolbachia pipientis]OEY86726.1 hypothetical protein BIY23_02620 [Wolbachia pipientis]